MGSEGDGSAGSGNWVPSAAGVGDSSQDSAETRPWTSGALVWKWQLGGGSYDSGADSSPS